MVEGLVVVAQEVIVGEVVVVVDLAVTRRRSGCP